MNAIDVKVNSLKAWFLAARPKTLTGAVAPVLIGLASAWSHAIPGQPFLWMPAVLCLIFAILMQIDANLINDYFDCIRGIDTEERLGPQRACAQGWISLKAMRRGIMLTTLFAVVCGLPLICYGDWPMLAVGLVCLIFCFLYTTSLARRGLGDVLVIVFFGLIPVGATCYLQIRIIPFAVWCAALACGIATDALLLVNNYRDRYTDAKVGKRTLVVSVGGQATEWIYLFSGIAAVALCLPFAFNGHLWASLLPCIYLLPHIRTWLDIRRINNGPRLNETLGATARNIFVFAVLLSIGILI